MARKTLHKFHQDIDGKHTDIRCVFSGKILPVLSSAIFQNHIINVRANTLVSDYRHYISAM